MADDARQEDYDSCDRELVEPNHDLRPALQSFTDTIDKGVKATEPVLARIESEAMLRVVEPISAVLDRGREGGSSRMDQLSSAIETGFASFSAFAAPLEKSVCGFLDINVAPQLNRAVKWGDEKLGNQPQRQHAH